MSRRAAPHPEFLRQWAGAVLVDAHGRVLLNLRSRENEYWPGQWDIIGGRLEADETPEECIAREVAEETGECLDAFAFHAFRTYDFIMQAETEQEAAARLHVYAARLDKDAGSLLVGEGQAHCFFSMEELGQIDLVAGIDMVLDDFRASPLYEALQR